MLLSQPPSSKVYPTLYSLTSTGATQIWYCEQQDGKFRVTSGQKNSQKLVTTEWTVCEGKNIGKSNETSPEDQAEKEIAALYKKKKKDKYFDSEDELGEDRYFKCMLAKSLNDYKEKIDWSKGVGVQIKFNGMRCIARRDGLFSRKGEPIISVPHIWNNIKHIFEKNPEAVFDGELFNFELRQKLNKLISLCRDSVHVTKESLEESERTVEYHVYDGGLNQDDLDSGYIVRQAQIDKALKDLCYCRKVVTWIVKSEAELNEIYNRLVDEGHEGVIVRILDQPYENKRSKNLLKFKPVESAEAIVVDILEGEGNWAGTGKVITLNWNGKIFNATFKGTYEQAVEFLKDKKKWIGKQVTFIFNGLTGLGVPNYARVDIDNCLEGPK